MLAATTVGAWLSTGRRGLRRLRSALDVGRDRLARIGSYVTGELLCGGGAVGPELRRAEPRGAEPYGGEPCGVEPCGAGDRTTGTAGALPAWEGTDVGGTGVSGGIRGEAEEAGGVGTGTGGGVRWDGG